MKPYGREKKVKGLPFKKDVHPKNGFVNWWESICDLLPRSTMKQNWKRKLNEDEKDSKT